jgi:hypothetical protein
LKILHGKEASGPQNFLLQKDEATIVCNTPSIQDFKSGEQTWQYQDVAAKPELTLIRGLQ